MTTINTIEDLARILRDQPTWAEALRALLLTQELLDLPGRFDRFVDAQREFNQAQQKANEAQQETNRLTDRRLNAIEGRLDGIDGRLDGIDGRLDGIDGRLDGIDGRLDRMDGRLDRMDGRMGNLQGGQYERTVRTRALARSRFTLGFTGSYVALNQDGLTDPRLNRAIDRAIRNGLVSQDGCADLFEADLIISAEDNRHAVVEVSLTADRDDIDRAKTRAGILADITEGAVTPVVITSRLNPAQSAQAEAAGVTTLVMPYP